jgi:hypothetical protein
VRNLLVLVAALFALVPWSPAAACDFKLGFARIHGELADRVGDCLTDEHYDATTGDALQETTGGLLVWRRADNTVAFTDGATTWLESRFGLVARANGERFAWEGPPPPPPPLAVRPINVGGVVLSDFRAGRADDSRYGTDAPYLSFALTNRWNVPMPVTNERMLYSAEFVDPARGTRYPGSLATTDPLPPEGLPPGARTSVVIYALVPSQLGLAPPQPPASVELYRGRMPGARNLVATFPLG